MLANVFLNVSIHPELTANNQIVKNQYSWSLQAIDNIKCAALQLQNVPLQNT